MASPDSITCADGVRLAADWHPADAPTGTVLIAAATGVGKEYYRALCAQLAAQGLNALRFDYRGIGASRAAARRGSFDMRTWAEVDLAAAIDAAQSLGKGLPLGLVGHSFGGQALGLAPNNTQVRCLAGVSAQSGHWRNWQGIHRLKMWATMHLVLPGVSAITGDLPAGLLGKDPLPRGVARQWAGWCRGPHYMADANGRPLRDGFDRWTGQARLLHISDDPMYAPLPAVRELASFYRNADVEVLTRTPADFGVQALGHFGFFRREAHAGWDELGNWLRDTLAT